MKKFKKVFFNTLGEMLADILEGILDILFHPYRTALNILLTLGVVLGVIATIDFIERYEHVNLIDLSGDILLFIIGFFSAVFLAITGILRSIRDSIGDYVGYNVDHIEEIARANNSTLRSINDTLNDINNNMKKDASNITDSDSNHQRIIL